MTHLHWAGLFAGSLIGIGILLSLASQQAEATRAEPALATVLHDNGLTVTVPLTLPAARSVNVTPATELPWQSITIKPGDHLSSLFPRLGLSPQQLHEIMALGHVTAGLARVKPGQEIKFRTAGNQLQELLYEVDEKSLHVKRESGKFAAYLTNHAVETRVSYAAGTIKSSLFEDAQAAGLSDNHTMEMADIFGWDIDFALDLREGDSFGVVYQEQFMNGLKLRDGVILAAEFTNRGKTYRAVRYSDPEGNINYYTPDGLAMRKAFLRTPVKFSRISSRFSLARYHPILHRMRAHKGVDYAAPIGTPVKAAGAGKVTFKGVKGGYGNVVILQHGSQYSTLYGHLHKFAPGLKQGAPVQQGQTIGYVGKTGLASGPHLHYEFRVAGVHKNPLTVTMPKADPIPEKYKAGFLAEAHRLSEQIALIKNDRLALKTP
ncbi:MAG: peptidoglycan DD-metalloendopeptidase family protein [Gammaproteobacteria bacterium]|nr:peptidoglycan DD-metalloendopeptidase family protein [Gammaproteobacteria bacterium]